MDRKAIKAAVRAQLYREYNPEQLITAGQAGLSRAVDESLRRLRVKMPADELSRLARELQDDLVGFGPIQPLLDDGAVGEILVNGPRSVFIERDGQSYEVDVAFDDEAHLRTVVQRMAGAAGRRIDEASPFVDLTLPDGTRVNAVMPPVAQGGTLLTLRKGGGRIDSLDMLVRRGSLDVAMARYLKQAIEDRLNILFAGATSTGKTTLLEILSAYIDGRERIVTIEDTPELRLRQRHVVRMITRPPNIEGKGEITLRQLFTNCLRMSPGRILLGEMRGGEAFEFLQALTSGHRGTLSVVHAASPEEAVLRLENLVALSGLHLPERVVRNQIGAGLDLIVQLVRFPDGSRKVVRISRVHGLLSDGMVDLRDAFTYRQTGADEQGQIVGQFVRVADRAGPPPAPRA